MLGLLTAVFYAGFLLGVKKLTGRCPVALILGGISLACAAMMLPAALIFEGNLAPSTGKGWVYLVALALVSHCLGQGLIAYALSRLPASLSTVSLLVQPAFVFLWGWVILGQAMVWMQGFAAVVIMVGIYLARKGVRAAND